MQMKDTWCGPISLIAGKKFALKGYKVNAH